LGQKVLIGLFRPGDDLVGVIDAFRDHPVPGEWWLGLLLLEPRERGQGLGRSVYDQFEGWAAAQGATTMWLSVVERNRRAYDFWGRLGFEEVERRPLAAGAGNPGTVIVMKRRVA
jgi:GNAT superfamily N-acetyltransferase